MPRIYYPSIISGRGVYGSPLKFNVFENPPQPLAPRDLSQPGVTVKVSPTAGAYGSGYRSWNDETPSHDVTRRLNPEFCPDVNVIWPS